MTAVEEGSKPAAEESLKEEEEDNASSLFSQVKQTQSSTSDTSSLEVESIKASNKRRCRYKDEWGGEDVFVDADSLCSVRFYYGEEEFVFLELDDPGIDFIYDKKPKTQRFDASGKRLYLFVCKALGVAPVGQFYKNLKKSSIDLKFRAINSGGVRAIAEALEANSFVERLSLADTWLSRDACYHLGLMLAENTNLTELDLSGCRLGQESMALIVEGLTTNFSVRRLNMSQCEIGDQGLESLALVLDVNKSLKQLNLSHNRLGSRAAQLLGQALKLNQALEELDLSWNNLFEIAGQKAFFKPISENTGLKKLLLKWNALSGEDVGKVLRVYLVKNQRIEHLDLSDNRLDSEAVKPLRRGVLKSASLRVLKLGKNPLTAEDVESFVKGLVGGVAPMMETLDFEDIWVEKSFLKTVDKIRQTRSIEVRIGGVYSNYELSWPDMVNILLKRAKFEASKPKKMKRRKDFGHLMWRLGDEPMSQKDFLAAAAKFKAKVDKNIYTQLSAKFKLPKDMVDVLEMRRRYLDLNPDSQPEPLKEKKGKKEKPTKEKEVPAEKKEPVKAAVKVTKTAPQKPELIRYLYEWEEGGELAGGEDLQLVESEEEQVDETVPNVAYTDTEEEDDVDEEEQGEEENEEEIANNENVYMEETN